MRAVRLALILLAVLTGTFLLWKVMQPELPRLPKSSLKRVAGVWQDSSGKPVTGILFDAAPDGQLLEEIPLREGLAHGLAKGWHPNGQLEVEEPFENGKSHGLRRRYHSNGQLLSTATIVQGVLHGPFREYHANGQLAAEMTLEQGLGEGPSQAWHPNGSIKAKATLHQGETVSVEHFPEK
jgi:antitoxin component YwqK of YwqJK toxin-antitoxin module